MTNRGEAGIHRLRLAALAAGTVIAVTLIWLGYDLLRPGASSCEAIFQQTEAQFGLKLKYLDAEGSLVLGRQQVQELTEQAQITALNLKSCCVVHESGALDAEGFLKCRDSGSRFEAKLSELSDRIKAVAAARDTGDEAAEEDASAAIQRLLEEAKSVSDALETRVSRMPRAPLKRSEGAFFRDDFSSESLGTAWEIRNPDPNRWALQGSDSTLLIVTQPGSQLESRNDLRNQFILNRMMPREDFTLEAKVRIPIQDQKNGASIGLWKDADNYLQVGYFGFKHGYNVRRSPFFLKEVSGEPNRQRADSARIGRVTESEIIYLRIERQGNKFIGSYAFQDGTGEADELEWHTIGTHAIPNFEGRPAIWADNADGRTYTTGGEKYSPQVPAEFDYVTLY